MMAIRRWGIRCVQNGSNWLCRPLRPLGFAKTKKQKQKGRKDEQRKRKKKTVGKSVHGLVFL